MTTSVLARPNSGSIAAMTAVVDQIIRIYKPGYDKLRRWTLLRDGKLVKDAATDCSALTGTLVKLAGYDLDISGTFYSANIIARLKAAGWRIERFRNLKQVKRGCVVRGPGHVIYAYSDTQWLSAEHDERGRDRGGKPGLQRGEFVGLRDPYLRSKGWTDVAFPPAEAVVISQPKALSMRVALAAQEAPRFGGSSDLAGRGRDAKSLGASVIGMTETLVLQKGKTEWAMRTAIAKELGTNWTRHVHEGGAICLFRVKDKYRKAGKVRQLTFRKGDRWHGALLVPLERLDAKLGIDIMVVHCRPRASFLSDESAREGKAADLRAALTLVGTWPAIIMGDFNQNADKIMAEEGFVRLTPNADSVTGDGDQRFDAVYARPDDLVGRNGALVKSVISDHLRAIVTIERPSLVTV